jgi:type IV pilus assembly protein PilE
MWRKQKGFTLMELMVVIVIVAILAAVAVPLYINYVKDAQRTEAKGAIGAIITAQQAYFQKNGGQSYADLTQLETQGLVDIEEAKANWTFSITPVASTSNPGFTVEANGISGRPTQDLYVSYDYRRDGTGAGWSDVLQPAGP